MRDPTHADLAAQIATLAERVEGMRQAAERADKMSAAERQMATEERKQLRRDISEIKTRLDVGKGRMWAILILFTAGVSAVGAGIGRWLTGN